MVVSDQEQQAHTVDHTPGTEVSGLWSLKCSDGPESRSFTKRLDHQDISETEVY